MSKNKMLPLLTGVALTVMAGGAWADWSFNNKYQSSNVAADQGVTATATAYYIANSSGNAFVAKTDKVSATNTKLTFNGTSGLGVSSNGESGSPNHAMDNTARTDMVLFSFSGLVELDYVSLGWTSNSSGSSTSSSRDADFSVLRYKGLDLPRDAGDGIASVAGVASPLRLSEHPPVLRNAPPALGQHTDEVLRELGLQDGDIAALRASGTV